MEEKKIYKKQLQGTVVSTSMNKTVVVRVNRVVLHPKYHKRYTTSKTYHVHDEKNECKKNDVVSIVECRPLSKKKRWRIINK